MKTATRYLILKRGRSVEEQMRAVLESRLTAVKDSEGNIVITEAAAEVKDSGSAFMTVNDVAALLQKPVSAIREMCKARAQRGPHPLPFTKLNGKTLRFDRVKVMRWIETMPQRPRRKR